MAVSFTYSTKGHIFLGLVLIYLIYRLAFNHNEVIRTHLGAIAPSLSRLWLEKLPPFLPDDLGPLTEHCREAAWEPGRVWECDYLSGGTSNVYNEVLNCIRFAIEAGATTLILPAVWKRSASEPVRIITGSQSDITDLSYLFDLPHLKTSLRSACPAMQVCDDISQVDGLPARPRSSVLNPKDLGASLDGAESFRANLDVHLARLQEDAGGFYLHPSYDYIVMTKTYFTWPISSDGPAFTNAFQSLLHPRADIRAFAAEVFARLKAAHGTNLPLNVPYYGAHLRTGSDLEADWARTGFSEQYASYTSAALAANITLVYVGGGVPADANRFVEKSWAEHAIVAVTKESLLPPGTPQLRALEALTSDQAALIDFEMLSRAARFGGMHRSSFAWQIALRRHTRSNLSVEECVRELPNMWEDEYSHILNSETDKWFDQFIWGTWP